MRYRLWAAINGRLSEQPHLAPPLDASQAELFQFRPHRMRQVDKLWLIFRDPEDELTPLCSRRFEASAQQQPI
jgi:hypothetical protein